MRLSLTALISTFLLTVTCATTLAQKEYFVTLNADSGTFNKISEINGVNWIEGLYMFAYDQQNRRYFFCGGPDRKNWNLYTLDANTGNVLHKPVFLNFTDPMDNIADMEYYSKGKELIGLHWDNTKKKEYFISIDPIHGTYNIISELPGVVAIQVDPIIDTRKGYFIFNGVDSAGIDRIYSVDIASGKIISEPPTGNNMWATINYDFSLNTVFGIYTVKDSGRHFTNYFGTFHPSDGTATPITTLDITSLNAEGYYYAYDEAHHHYIGVWREKANHSTHLFLIDALNGNIISNITFNYVSDVGDNVICYKYDNQQNKLYALHWEAHSPITTYTTDTVDVYPNPLTTETHFVLKHTYTHVTIMLYNELKQLLREDRFENTSFVTYDRKDLPAGVYFAKVYGDNRQLGVVKLVIR